MMDKRFFIFDFDGTLFNSIPVFDKIDDTLMSKHNIIFNREEHEDAIGGFSVKQLTEYLVKTYKMEIAPELLYQEREALFVSKLKEVKFIEGALAFLRYLKQQGKKVGIASATDPAYFNIIVKTYPELNELTDNTIVTCAEVGKSKPDPAVYLECLRRLGGSIKDGIVFEDSYQGLKGARASGMLVCGIISDKQSYEKKVALCDLHYDNFLPLLK